MGYEVAMGIVLAAICGVLMFLLFGSLFFTRSIFGEKGPRFLIRAYGKMKKLFSNEDFWFYIGFSLFFLCGLIAGTFLTSIFYVCEQTDPVKVIYFLPLFIRAGIGILFFLLCCLGIVLAVASPRLEDCFIRKFS